MSTNLVRNEFYTFVGTAQPGSDAGLVDAGKRLYTHAQFVGPQGGDFVFSFNGLRLYVHPGDVREFANDKDFLKSAEVVKSAKKEERGGRRRRHRRAKMTKRRKVRGRHTRKA